MKRIPIGLAAALLASVLAMSAASPAAAADELPPECALPRTAVVILANPFVLKQSGSISTLGLTLTMEAGLTEVNCFDGSHYTFPTIPNATLVFSAGGKELCRGTTAFPLPTVKCSWVAARLDAVLALVLAGRAQVSFAGDSSYQPASASVPAIGPPGIVYPFPF